MKTWIKDKMKSDYMQRQFYMMGNLGLFYLIMIAMFAVPLLGTFVVVIIKGVLDFRYLILAGGILILALFIFYGVKFSIKMFQKIRKDGGSALREAQNSAGAGEPVQLGMFNGLVTLSYGGENERPLLPQPHNIPALPLNTAGNFQNTHDPIRQLRELSELKKDGIIDENEFMMLKQKLIQNVCGADENKKD